MRWTLLLDLLNSGTVVDVDSVEELETDMLLLLLLLLLLLTCKKTVFIKLCTQALCDLGEKRLDKPCTLYAIFTHVEWRGVVRWSLALGTARRVGGPSRSDIQPITI